MDTDLNQERKCSLCGKTVHLYGFEQLRDEDIFCVQCWIEDKIPKDFKIYGPAKYTPAGLKKGGL